MLKYWRVALLAFVAMCIQDILATCMVVFEARLNGPVAGLFDDASWLAGLICMALSLGEINKTGWRSPKSLAIIGAICLANFVGTVVGVQTAKIIG